jgi:hypothetical protein
VSQFIKRIVRKQIYTMWAKCRVTYATSAGTYPRPTKCRPHFLCLCIGLYRVKYVLTAFPCSNISVLRYDLFFCIACFCNRLHSCLVLALKRINVSGTESFYFHFLSPSLSDITPLTHFGKKK